MIKSQTQRYLIFTKDLPDMTNLFGSWTQDQRLAPGVQPDFGTIGVVLVPSRTASLAPQALGAARTAKRSLYVFLAMSSLMSSHIYSHLCLPAVYVHSIVKIFVQEGALSRNACMECPSGRYSNRTGLSSLVQCDSCPGGTWSDVAGATKGSVCQKCAAGKWSPQIAAVTEASGLLQKAIDIRNLRKGRMGRVCKL